ncbi:MAG: RNA polymerase sigma factor [Phycisphaerae bacterium]|nr:RNA polymerase sigma factor [Phycisphaerae bacterium]
MRRSLKAPLDEGPGALSTRGVPELLAEFEATGNQAPFEEIVRRYAGMVYNVCYQVSRDAHDAEDATQAVFLTLAVRSKTAQKIQYLGPWLQRVAQRLSLDMKRSKRRRGARELKHHDMNLWRWEQNCQPADLGLDELRGILRDEIDRLPAKYRMPLILHYFGGLKPDEMSRELGIKANTLGVRLHRARKMLGEALQKRGIVVGGAMLSTALASLIPFYVQQAVASTACAATAQGILGQQLVAQEIAAGVIGTMRLADRAALLGKIKAVTAAVAIGVAAVAGGKEVLRQLRAYGLEFRGLDLNRWLAPLTDWLRPPIRLSGTQTAPELPAPAARVDSPTARLSGLDAPLPEAQEDGFVLASPSGGLTPDSIRLERIPLGIPIRPDTLWREISPTPPRVAPAPPVLVPPLTQRPESKSAATPMPASVLSLSPVAPPVRDANAAFSSARGAFVLENGLIHQPAITIDSTTAALRSFRVTGGEVRTPQLTIAQAGTGEMIQVGGAVTTEQLTIGVQPGASGVYQLSGEAQLTSDLQRVGVEGNGLVEQSGGVNRARQIALGEGRSGSGRYTLRDGRLTVGDLRVGIEGRGHFTQTGGTAVVASSSPRGGITVAERPSSEGTISIGGGEISADNVFVAIAGDGSYNLRGGRTIASKIVLGGTESADARLQATEGEIVFVSGRDSDAASPPHAPAISLATARSASAAWTAATSSALPNVFAVGVNGDALVELGGKSRSVTVREGARDSATPLVVGATPGSDAVVRGWGEIALRGPLVQNGKLIADGMGRERVLDMSTVSSVHNTIDNDIDGASGMYALRKGSLRLPAVRVDQSGNYNWGESPDDPVPDLVNSVRIGFRDVTRPGEVTISLLSVDLAEGQTAPPSSEFFVGLWRLERDGLDHSSTDLLVRYDEHLVHNLGLPETALSLWTFHEQWSRVEPADLLLDAERNLIGASSLGVFDYFAVAISGDLIGGFPPFLTGRLADANTLDFGPFASVRDVVISEDLNSAMPAPGVARGVPEPSVVGLVVAAGALLGRRRWR